MIRKVVIKGIIRKLIKIKDKWYYKNHFCKHCGKRIPYKESQKKNGIPDFIRGHQVIGKYNPMSGKHHTQESIEKIRESASGENNVMFGKHRPEHMKMLCNKCKEYRIENPEAILKHMELMHKAGKQYDTSIELIVYAYLLKLFPDYTIVKQQKIIDYENNKLFKVDFFIVELTLVVEVNGCYHHECVDCHPLTEDIHKTSEKQHKDTLRIDFLRRYGLNVVVIWQHDIKNGKYKKILKNLIKET